MAQNSVINFKIKGAKEMERVLRELPPEVASTVGDQALRAASKVIADEAKRNVHQDDGDLHDSIIVIVNRKSKKAAERLAQVTFKPPTSRRAHLEEFGTSTYPAHPFLRPAADSKAKESLQAFSKVIARGLARETKKLSKPPR